MLREKDRVEAQEKHEGWHKVAKLLEQAQAVLVQVNEGPCELPKLQWLQEKAETQSRLWSVGGE